MGIRLLHTFLSRYYNSGKIDANNEGIKEVSLEDFRGKKIAIDVSIYMYRFLGVGQLIENLYSMCAIFRSYDIHPIFVFDGKPPASKQETIKKRRQEKHDAKMEFDEIRCELDCYKDGDRYDLITKMDELQKKFISVRRHHVLEVQQLFDAQGITYICAEGEADELCAALVINGDVYACMSEDTDLMAYGCQIVLRYFSLMKHTVVVYDLKEILKGLRMSMEEFRELCVSGGSDYHVKTGGGLFMWYKRFKKYKRLRWEQEQVWKEHKLGKFLDWLLAQKYISLQEYHERQRVCDIYTLQNMDDLLSVLKGPIENKKVDTESLYIILEKVGFVFPPKASEKKRAKSVAEFANAR